jgi:hypothetical protein
MTTDFRPLWKHIATNRTASSYHFVQYAALRALHQTGWNAERSVDRALKFLNKAFTPVTNRTKIKNGVKPLFGLTRAIAEARFKEAVGRDILGGPPELLSTQQHIIFLDLLNRLADKNKVEEFFARQYVYIFVRQDIFLEYQLVQASHVALKLGFEIHKKQGDRSRNAYDPSNLYFTVVGVPDLPALHQVWKKHIEVDFVEFKEPDIGNEITAIASWPIPVRERGNLLNYKLLKFNREA